MKRREIVFTLKGIFMKKIIQKSLLSLILSYPVTVSAQEIVLMLDVSDTAKKGIYETLVTKTGLHKKSQDNYHVTVAWIKDVDSKDYKNLKKMMQEKLDHYKTLQQIEFEADHADRYLLGGREEDNCPVVLFPTKKSKEILDLINVNLETDLKSFTSSVSRTYKFISEVKPENYQPHITLANTKHINEKKVDRDSSITMINKKIKGAGEKYGSAYRVTLY